MDTLLGKQAQPFLVLSLLKGVRSSLTGKNFVFLGVNLFLNPTAIRTAETPQSFDHSECSTVKEVIHF